MAARSEARRERRLYEYRMLGYSGALSTTFAVLVALLGGLTVVGLLATMTEGREGESLVMAIVVGVMTAVVAVSIAVVADVVRWMLDVVDLLDEQVDALDQLHESPER